MIDVPVEDESLTECRMLGAKYSATAEAITMADSVEPGSLEVMR